MSVVVLIVFPGQRLRVRAVSQVFPTRIVVRRRLAEVARCGKSTVCSQVLGIDSHVQEIGTKCPRWHRAQCVVR